MTITSALVVINVLAFGWEWYSGTNFSSNQSLFAHGGLYGPAVVRGGEWWRIVTSAFLHAGIPHIALNMIALAQIGSFVEGTIGSLRMLAVYTIAMIGGGLAVVYFAPNDVTVGASGAIFGLFGATLAIGLRLGARGRGLIAAMLPVVVLNLAFTFAIPFISKAGHLGGLVSGFVAGLIFFAIQPAPSARAEIVDEPSAST